MKTGLQAIAFSVVGFVLIAVLLFWPAGTLNYWEAWLFIAMFAVLSTVYTVYLGIKDPEVLRRRMHSGPIAETRTAQKVIVLGIYVWFFGVAIVSGLDHRFAWSVVPTVVALIGSAVVAIGLGITMLVVVQNSYAAATVRVEAGQQVVSTGLYGLVRHPMYFGALIMMIGLPVALGSYWGLILTAPGVPVLVFRILDEEKALRQELAGYAQYTQQVRYRLLPYVW
ncbi:methyltransferase family protein [Mycolicibacterium sp. XJ870]